MVQPVYHYSDRETLALRKNGAPHRGSTVAVELGMRCSSPPLRSAGSLLPLGGALVVTSLVHAARAEPTPAETVPFAPAGGTAITVPFGPGAGPSAPTAPPSTRSERGQGRWYGYYTAPVDVLAGTLVVLAFTAETPSRPAQVGAAAAFALGAPLVHLAHGKPLRALLDLGVRASLPALGYYLGGVLGAGPIVREPALVGALVGGACAGIVDWLGLSWDTAGDLPASRVAGAPSLAPSLALTPSGGALALGGAF